MNDKERSSEILQQTPVVISDDTSSDKEELPSLNLSKEQSDRVVPHSESSTETQTNLQAENGVALRNQNEEPMSESEIALRDLNNKLKEVQSKLNLNTPVKSKPNANNAEAASSNISEDNTESGASNRPLEIDKTSFYHETPNTINSSTATTSSMDSVANTRAPKTTTLNVDSSTTESGNAGVLLTPQNEKQVAECWSSLGVQRCRFCKFSTNDTKLFEIHTTTCTPKVIVSFSDGIYTCETCELTWINKAEFEEHVVCHTTNDPYVCINCKKAFESRLLTEQHAKTDHPSGGSVYGLRGMKKSRKIVEELEVQGKHMFRGKLKIPPTPRSKQNSNTTTQASDEVVKTGQSDEMKGPQMTEIAANSNMAAELKKDNTITCTSKESSCKPEQPNKNTELIEQNMEQLRQFLISQGSMAGVSDSKGTVQDKQSISLNETVKTGLTTVTHASSSSSSQNGMLVKEQKLVPAVTNSGSVPGSETCATLHYQTNQTQADIVLTKPSQIAPSVPFGPVSQPVSTSLISATSIINKTGPPNVVINKDFMSKETGTERIAASVGTQGTSPQQQRQYLFTEYIHPPPPRPRITLPSSLKPLPTVHTTVQTGTAIAVPTSVQTGSTIAVPTSVQTGATVGVPSAVKSNSAPILLIPIPPVFNNSVSTMSNVLIPIPASHQANQKLVKSFVNYPVPNTGASVNTLSNKPKMAGPVVQQLSHIAPSSPSDRPVLINTFVNSKPQLVLTSNSFATQPTVSRLTPSIQGQHSVSNQSTPVMKSLLNKMAEKSISVPSSIVNVSANSAQRGKKPTESVSPVSTPIKDPIPTVEIFLPDKTHDQQKDNTQNDANNMPGTQFNLSKRFLFRIRPGHGFVCEACRKFTQDEVIFRRHVWDHFHTVTKSCKFCSQDKVIRKDFMNCKLVSNVVCSLVKKSTNQGKSHAQGGSPEKAISVVDDEVIAISDEEDNTKSAEPVLMGTSDVIILDEEEDSSSNKNSEIKIASTYSLSKTEKQSKDGSHPVEDIISEKENAESIKSGKSVIKDVVENEKGVTIFNQCDKANTKTSNESKLSAKRGEVTVTSVSISDNVEKNENEQTSCEKHNAAKDMATAKVSSDEIQRFEKRVVSTRKEYAFYMCGFDQCSFTALKSKHYKEHLTANHSGAYNYVCGHCGLKNYTEDAHIRHVNSHANMKVFLLFNCPFRPCKYKTNLMHMFKGHLLSHKEDVLKCTYCHKTFESVELLICHLKANLIKFVSCSHCQFKFQLKDMVAKHIKLAHPEKPRIVVVSSQILCLERELNFYSPPLAKARASEKQIDQRVEEFTALAGDLNKAAFYSSDNMQNEMVNNNFISSGSIPDDDHNEVDNRPASSPLPPVLTAESTGGKQKNASDAEKSTEPNRIIQNDTSNAEPPRSLMCPKCNFISWNYKLHQQHISLHETDEPEREKRFVCMYCPKGFDVFNPFKTHVSNHVGHHEIKIYCCTLCVFTTSQRYHIIDHCKDNHLGTGTYFQKTDIVVSKESSCKYCDFKSRQAEQVQLHEKIVHINSSGKQNKKTDSSKQVDEQSTSASQSETEPVSTESSDHNQKNRKYHCHYCMEYFKHKADLRAHMQNSHLDIENKSFVTFKCKYCHFTSTMKALIMTHIDRKHANEQIRILRRIENVDMPKTDTVLRNNDSVNEHDEDKTTYRCEMCDLSMDSSEKFKKHFSDKHANFDSERWEREQTEKETVYIPDGNIFKEPVECPKCSYSNRLRVNILRHIKEHPELVPSRSQAGTETSPSKVTARKSTSKVLPVKVGEKQLKNPFAAVKDAVRELDKTDTDNSKELEQLSLGGDFLHGKLSACFIPLEKEYKCRICQQNIVKKFVLHRHILNHLQVVFFKCHYCHKGDIEQSLLSGHIQQEHSLKQVKFDYCKLHEICNEIKDRISEQNFSDSVPLPNIHASQSEDDSRNNVDIIREQVHEANQKDDKEEKEISIFKCSKCDYYAKNEYFLKLHRNDHINPGSKKYGCTVCGYRGMSKQHILRHMKTSHPNHPLKYTVLGNNAGDKDMELKAQGDRSDENVTFKQNSHKNTSETSSGRVLATKKAGMKKTKRNVVRSENITISEAGVFDMKTLYKCKECGEKTKAKWAMYDHFKNSKCHRRWYRCECCAFSNPFKNAITKHAKIRHCGKKVKIIELPLSAKMRLIKIPVKQNKQVPKVVEGPRNSQDRQKSETFVGTKVSSVVSSLDSVGSEIHTCRLCSNYKSDSLSKLQFHLNTKHQGKPLFCVKCNYKTPLVKHIINHCQNVHKMETAQYSLNEQEDGGDEDETENIETTNMKRKNDQIKASKSVETGYKKYKCPNCDISTDAIKRLRDHMQIHFSYKPYVCKYCSKRQQHFANVKRHVSKCHSGLEVKYSMVKDKKIELKLDRLVAQILKQRSNESVKATPKETETHIRKKAEKRSRDADEDIQPSKKKKPVIETDDESSEESSVDDRSRPSPVKYRVTREPGTSTKLYQCVQCDYNTDKKDSLHGHLKTHGKKSYKCWYCGYLASFRSYVVKHSRRVHKEKPLKVVDQKTNEVLAPKRRKVAYDSSSESSADESVLPFETSKKMVTLKYFCNFCDYAVIGLYHFRQHLATHKEFRYLQKGTEIESRLSCGYCSYMAVDDADFSKHISDHLDERPYKCGHCDYSSYHRNQIQAHLTTSHPEEEEIILDNKDIDRDTFKGKQVMLVDLDPQVVLKRLKSDSKVVDNENSNKQVSEKLKMLVTKSSPSKSNFEAGNIFIKLSNADGKFKSENSSDERKDILTKENKKEMECDVNKTDSKDKENISMALSQKQELQCSKLELVEQPVKMADDDAETSKQLSDVKANEVSNQKQTLNQQSSLETDVCKSEMENKFDGQQNMEAGSNSDSKMENDFDIRGRTSGQCPINVTPESKQKMNLDKHTDSAVDIIKGNEDLLGNSVKKVSAIDRDEVFENIQSGESFTKETEKCEIDAAQENIQIDAVQEKRNKNRIHIEESGSIKESLMEPLSSNQAVKPAHAHTVTEYVSEHEMCYSDEELVGNRLQIEPEQVQDRPENADLDVDITEDRYTIESAEDANTQNADTTKFSNADQEENSLDHNKGNYISKVDISNESEIIDCVAVQESDKVKEGTDRKTDTLKTSEKSQEIEPSENLGGCNDSETQNFEIYDESQPFNYEESQPFEYVNENEMKASSEDQIDTIEEQDSKLADGTIMESLNVSQSIQFGNTLAKPSTCSFQDKNEDFGYRQDTVDGERKPCSSTCTLQLGSSLTSESERQEKTTNKDIHNDFVSNTTDTGDDKLNSIHIKTHIDTSLENKNSDDASVRNTPLCTSDRCDVEPQSELLMNENNGSRNEKIESLCTEIESLCTEIENRVDKTEMCSDNSTIQKNVKTVAFVLEKSETFACFDTDAAQSANSRNELHCNEMENTINKSENSTENTSICRDIEPEASVREKSENHNCFGKDAFESDDAVKNVEECDQNKNEDPASENKVVISDKTTSAAAYTTDTTYDLQVSGTTEAIVPVEMENDNDKLTSKKTDIDFSEYVESTKNASSQSVHSDHGSYTKN